MDCWTTENTEGREKSNAFYVISGSCCRFNFSTHLYFLLKSRGVSRHTMTWVPVVLTIFTSVFSVPSVVHASTFAITNKVCNEWIVEPRRTQRARRSIFAYIMPGSCYWCNLVDSISFLKAGKPPYFKFRGASCFNNIYLRVLRALRGSCFSYSLIWLPFRKFSGIIILVLVLFYIQISSGKHEWVIWRI